MAVSTFWEKQVTCPLCTTKFSVKNVRQGTFEALKRDTDFCVWYKGANPLLYSIYVCPSCGYSTIPEDFEKMDKRTLARFNTSFHQHVTDDFTGLRDPHLAIKAHLLAIESYKLKDSSEGTQGGLLLRIAWLYRQEGDEQAELQYMTLARDTYKVAYENARNLPSKLGEIGVAYLIGELSRRLGDNNTAIRWYSVAINNKNIKTRPDIEKLARAQWQSAREGYVEKKQAQSQGVYFSVPNLSADEAKAAAANLTKPGDLAGTEVQSFEAKIAAVTQSRYAIATNGISSAFDSVLNALNLKPGDDVLLPALVPNFVASSLVVRGVKPVIVDVLDNLTIDVDKAGSLLNGSTKAIIAVDYAGQLSNADKLSVLCGQKGLSLIELAMESIGGKYSDGSSAGKHSTVTCYDFSLGHLQTVSGGAVTTDNEGLASALRSIISQGSKSDNNYYLGTANVPSHLGVDGSMSQFSASVALSSAARIGESLNKCAGYARLYTENLGKFSINFVNTASTYTSFPIVLELKDKKIDEIIAHFVSKQIFAKRISPPISLSPILNSAKSHCPKAERLFETTILLPLNPTMTQSDIERVIATVREALA